MAKMRRLTSDMKKWLKKLRGKPNSWFKVPTWTGEGLVSRGLAEKKWKKDPRERLGGVNVYRLKESD